jgi:hypothetical protein
MGVAPEDVERAYLSGKKKILFLLRFKKINTFDEWARRRRMSNARICAKIQKKGGGTLDAAFI